ncbi:hypothetical protein BGZ65_005229 [Modicella reniformis]|uniref:Uncharacterized protein n=1 Tax=Modicella reniformis TaxID=1440133 RepID=A0A9P6IJX1_9FUNG|nr:hypothetical protein BGZ65_005229 [Modicella reniformis]
MNETPSQAFRAQFSSQVVTIPTRYDPTSRQHVVRWRDIQQRFKDAQYITNGGESVPFLTNDVLDDFIPLRIAQHPNVVLDVVTTDTIQGDSSDMLNPNSTLMPMLAFSSMNYSPGENVSNNDFRMETITEIDDNQALVVHTQGLLSEILVQGTEGFDQLRQLKQQLQEKMQQTDKQTQHTLQHIQQQVDEILQQTQQKDRQKQQIDMAVEKMEQQSQQVEHSQQQMQQRVEEALQKMQQVNQQQQQREQIEKILQMTQEMHQQTQHSHQQLLHRIEEAVQKTQQDQQKQLIDEILQKIEQQNQQAEQSQQQVQQYIKETLQKTQQVDQQQGSAMQWLEKVITTSGGSYCEEAGEVEIKITSDELAKSFYDGMIKVCGIQLSPTVLELKLDCNGSIKNPTADIITINLNGLNSLSLDFERHSLTAMISQGEVKDVKMKIVRLGDLSQDDVEFIKQCHAVQLQILHTPQQSDEDRLLSILHHIPMLKELHIYCLDARSLATIDLVISARDKILQSGGSLTLGTFKLMADKEALIGRASAKYHNSIEAEVSFSERSATFDMETDIQLQSQLLVAKDNLVCDFVCRYGWSIKSLVLPWTFSDYFAVVLDESTQERGSQIVSLEVDPISLTKLGTDALGRTIKRSQQLASLKFNIRSLDQGNVLKYAQLLVAHGGWLTSLYLSLYWGENKLDLPQLSQAIPNKSVLPTLQELTMQGYEKTFIPPDLAQLIAAMIATPPLSTDPQVTRLKNLDLSGFSLSSTGWEAVINAIDHSALERLRFSDTNFTEKELTLLVSRIASYASRSVLPSIQIFFHNTNLANHKPDTQALYEWLQEVAPNAQVHL